VAARDVRLAEPPASVPRPTGDENSLRRRQLLFGYTQEDLTDLVGPMASAAKEPNGSMGDDTPLAVLSRRSRPLFDYFTQRFARSPTRRSTRCGRAW
jgi:glutamate synthase (NADPH/NADH) large chain